MKNNAIITGKEIESRIYTIRGQQVMLDSYLASIYQVETKVFNQAVKRHSERFPENFRFQLTQDEFNSTNLRSQIVTSSVAHGGRRYLPYAFTEQGIAMLSAILRSEVAIKVSIEIMNAFVAMRKALIGNAALLSRMDDIELKQLETDGKLETIFKALERGKLRSEKGIFYDGQIFDAYTFISDIIRSAQKSIILIDNYVDDTVLTLLGKRDQSVSATIYTKSVSNQLRLDVKRYNSQYPPIAIHTFANSHDRFLIIDGTELYHIGGSLKDLGKKWFAFSKMNSEVTKMLNILNDI